MSVSEHSASSEQVRWEIALGVLGLWSIAVPFAATALGMHLDVARRLEIADHVIPGLVIAGAIGLLVWSRRGAHPNTWAAPWALGIVFLAGLWITATHVPLIFQAADHRQGADWDAAIFHSVWGPPILVVSTWLLWRELAPEPQP